MGTNRMGGRTAMRKLYVVLGVVALLGAACGSDPDLVGAGGGGQAPEGATIVALDNVFGDKQQSDVRIDPGARVTWLNNGRNDHNIIPIDTKGYGVAAEDFRPGDSYSHVFEDEGVYEYYCDLHGTKDGGMKGRLLVGDVKAPDSTADELADIEPKASGDTIRVPADQPSVQKAVDAANPGDLILIAPGTYREAVDVPETKPYLTIRGEDRNKVIMEGEFKRANAFKVVKANGVAIENMTAQNYTKNGFFWTGVEGYRGSYLTAIRNGDYGVYAFESTKGQFDHSYATGSPDAGFYIGGCQPCDALITDVVSEWNGLGYSGTNAGGNLVIANSEWRFNRAGIVPNSGSYEPDYPQRTSTIVGNYVHDNSNEKTAAIDVAVTVVGNGIVVAGGEDNLILRNRVEDHAMSGILMFTYPENEDYVWIIRDNEVRENVISGSALGDIGYFHDFEGGTDPDGNCFADNQFGFTRPNAIEEAAPCDGEGTGNFSDQPFEAGKLATNEGKAPSVPYEQVELPAVPDQPNMPDALDAPGNPAVDLPAKIDIDAIQVPPAR